MANKLKLHDPVKIGGEPRTTRLGKTLRRLIEDYPDYAHRLKAAADNLDMAVVSTGTKGEGIKMLGSYHYACRVYRDITGAEYQPTR